MLGQQLVVLADAHLGAVGPEVEEALLAFLETVPTLGDCLLVNGDLFDFWFSYRRVIPRRGFHVAAALGQVRRRIPVVMIGGNHDRWGGDFWQKDLGIAFHPVETRFAIGGRAVLAVHGDGLTEQYWSAEWMHHLTRNRLTIALWKAMHPDWGFWLVDKMSRGLGYSTREPSVLEAAAAKQQAWAEGKLAEEPTLGLVVMGHTHRPALIDAGAGRQYLNPGAWMEGFRYAVATETGATLRHFAP